MKENRSQFCSKTVAKKKKKIRRGILQMKERIFKILIIYLFGCIRLSCTMWDLVPRQGIEPRPLTVKAHCLSQ